MTVALEAILPRLIGRVVSHESIVLNCSQLIRIALYDCFERVNANVSSWHLRCTMELCTPGSTERNREIRFKERQ